MRVRRIFAALLGIAAATLSISCAPRRTLGLEAGHTGPVFGVYRGWISRADGEVRRFRLLLYAALPDRLHAEVLPPLGSPELILDAGDGRLAVTFMRQELAFVGEARPEAVEHALGLPMSLEDLIGCLLGASPVTQSVRVFRWPETPGQLPERFEVTSSTGLTLRLERKGIQPILIWPKDLATGTPPASVESRPLEDLGGGGLPALFGE